MQRIGAKPMQQMQKKEEQPKSRQEAGEKMTHDTNAFGA